MKAEKKIYIIVSSIALGIIFLSGLVRAATNISATTSDHWAWNDAIGWIDFYNTSNITVSSQKLTGYASSSVGDISLDCATTRNGDICSTSDYKVLNDGNGNLSGWGWNDIYGWVSFYCGNHNGCGASNYRVLITTGNFSGYAWNDVVGWISFNCAGPPDQCGTSNYRVVTSWTSTSTTGYVDSSTFDTGVSGGAQVNSILWQGSQPAGTAVRFQVAVSSTSTGPWSYKGPLGTSVDYYTTDPGVSKETHYTLHSNNRYFRYRITLVSNEAQTSTPKVDDVVVNWSR
ncbi:MAG: hypothetical protein AAB495_01270 [Patescibacteria group bacterium]